VRRAVVYLFYDPEGLVDDYVLHVLRRLRPHAELVFVVSNAPLDTAARARLGSVADRVWARANVGMDVWAYKEALEHLDGELDGFDEVVLMNHTFFGPVGTFDDVFAEMDARTDLDFWGVTEHGRTRKHPFDQTQPMRAHIQSHWIAVRRRMLDSPEWRDYWDSMPMIEDYQGSVLHHESRFTHHFRERGFRCAVAFPAEDFHGDHPVMDDTAAMLRAGCPIVKRRVFFHDPLYHESNATDGRLILRLLAERGFPTEMLLRNLARTSRPRSLVTNLGLLEVLPDVDLGYDTTAPLRVVAVAHLFYPEMTDEIVDHLDHLPGDYDLVVTTSDEDKRAAIEATLQRRGRRADVRIVASNRGRDVSAFLVDCRDVLESGRYDVVVKVHSKKQPQDPPNVAELFKRHLLENLLGSPGYAANVLRLFQQHPSLGMVFPPVYHVGYPTLGHAWFLNKQRAKEEARRLGIMVPLDETTPVAAYGSMFIARPEALHRLVGAGYTHDDFPDETGYGDGALSHVLERLMSYAVLSTGHHVREVMNADSAALNYSYLEYRAIAVGRHLPAYPREQIKRIKKLKKWRRTARIDGIVDETGRRAAPMEGRRTWRWGATRAPRGRP
jgi:lipopolysaccharide biosynthesis protein